MMLGLIHLGDVTGQCAAGLNPNYDDNGVFTSCTEGSPAPPNCVSGQVTTFDDGSYGCTPGVTAQSVGVAAPDCGGGSPYLDGNGDWQCSAPPAPSSSGGLGSFLVSAGLAVAAYFYFANKATSTYKSLSSGDPKQILSSGVL